MSPHLLLAAVCSLRPLGGAAQRRAVVAEVAGWVHLVLRGVRRSGGSAECKLQHRKHMASADVCGFSHLQDLKLVSVDFAPGFLQPGDGTHVHPS